MRPRREAIRGVEYSYFVSTQMKGRTPLFRHDRWARLMGSVLRHYDGLHYRLHAYVVMPDHIHALLTPVEAIERSMQLIKGGFSFRAKRELEWHHEIWQTGFSDHRVRDEEDWHRHVGYIRSNPVRAGLVQDSKLFEYIGFPDTDVPQGLKPVVFVNPDVRAEARTLQHAVGVQQGDQKTSPGSISAGVPNQEVRPKNRAISTKLITHAGLLLFLFTFSAVSRAQKASANAEACGADVSQVAQKIYARGFTGGWKMVSAEDRHKGGWGQTAQVWTLPDSAGNFVELQLMDEPQAGGWFQRIDYCFGADGSVRWIDTRYNRAEQDSRVDHFEFDEHGAVVKHSEQCLNTRTGMTRPADEGCQDASAFPIVKQFNNFAFFKQSAKKQE